MIFYTFLFLHTNPATTVVLNNECTRLAQSLQSRDVISRWRTEHLNADEEANPIQLSSRYFVSFLKWTVHLYNLQIKSILTSKL